MPLSIETDGKAPEKKRVRRPASILNSFLCFREIKYENIELEFSLSVRDLWNPLSLCIYVFRGHRVVIQRFRGL